MGKSFILQLYDYTSLDNWEEHDIITVIYFGGLDRL